MSDEVACERTFQTLVADEPRPVVVEWFRPRADQNDWRCDYAIHWPHRPMTRRYAMGVDSAQALLLAMKAVSAALYDAEPPVFWHEPDDVLDLPLMRGDETLEAARSKGHSPRR